ncbi:MAG: LysM peptidoglycan-binding domain-containing protein [Bacillaceae bacterium]|nr:LysM peptidoglycan-binding domain-containing protein [Bacillaceae bacterium]
MTGRREDMSSLRFELQETVFLDQDRPGIDQIEEIQLVPEIEVLEREGEVRIAGYLALFGQYKGKSESLSEDEEEKQGDSESSSVKIPPFQVEQSAFSPWRKKGEIYHHIPVNIILPEDRIANLDDVFAVVDSFDYEIESPRHLLISAELVITGIVTEEDQLLAKPFLPEDKWSPVSGKEDDRDPGWGAWFPKSDKESSDENSSWTDSNTSLSNESQSGESNQVSESSNPDPESDTSDYQMNLHGESGSPESKIEHHSDYDESENVESAQDSFEDSIQSDSETESESTESREDENVVPLFQDEAAEPEEPQDSEPPDQPDRKIIRDDSESGDVKVAITGKGNRDDHKPVDLSSVFRRTSPSPVESLSRESQGESTEVGSDSAVMEDHDSRGSEESPRDQQDRYDSYPEQDESWEESSRQDSFEKSMTDREPELTDEEESTESRGESGESASEKEDALYLTQFLENKEEDFTRLKIVIVQKEESIDAIAERYSVSVESILSRNKLESRNLEAGQILYMPG